MMPMPASLALLFHPTPPGPVGTVSFVGATGAIYVSSGTTIASPNTPPGVTAGDGLFAVVMARSNLTPPAGWTLVESRSVTAQGFTQTIYLYRRGGASSADSSTAFTWTQSSSGRMGLAYLLVRSSTGALVVAEHAGVDTPASSTIAPIPMLTSTVNGELFIMAATAIVAAAEPTWVAPAGATLRTTATAPENRLAAATHSRDAGLSNGVQFTSSGSDHSSGITVRLQPA